jgi:prepilin signal peptidase PulO-like enzyme (type II secretory pathway)
VHSVLTVIAAVLAGLLAGLLMAVSLDRLYPSNSETNTSAPRLRALLIPALGLYWGACALRSRNSIEFLLLVIFGSILLLLSATDFERHLLPNRVMYPALVAGLALSLAWPGRPVLSGPLGGAVGAAVMLLVFLVFPGFGFGDVKLAGLIGLALGFPGIFYGLLAGMILGGIGAAWLLLTGRARLRSTIAYGPYLAGGAILIMLLRR